MKKWTKVVDFVQICTYNGIMLGGDRVNYKVAKELKAERVKRDLKISDVAKQLGTCNESIRRYEKGTKKLSLELVERLLNIYGIDPAVFFANVCANMHV